MKFIMSQERLTKLESDHQISLKNNESLNKELFQLQNSNDKLKKEFELFEEQLKRELEEARVESDDLSDLLKTKDRMLED